MKAFPIYLLMICCWVVADRPANEGLHMFYESYVGHTETHGSNRSKHIDYWNKRLGLPMGSSWCASMLAAGLDSARAEYPVVRSGVAQHYITSQSIKAGHVADMNAELPTGTIGIFKRGNTWMGHNFITDGVWKGGSGYTIEGNTSPGYEGSQYDGNGVWRKYRRHDPTAYFRLEYFTYVH